MLYHKFSDGGASYPIYVTSYPGQAFLWTKIPTCLMRSGVRFVCGWLPCFCRSPCVKAERIIFNDYGNSLFVSVRSALQRREICKSTELYIRNKVYVTSDSAHGRRHACFW